MHCDSILPYQDHVELHFSTVSQFRTTMTMRLPPGPTDYVAGLDYEMTLEPAVTGAALNPEPLATGLDRLAAAIKQRL